MAMRRQLPSDAYSGAEDENVYDDGEHDNICEDTNCLKPADRTQDEEDGGHNQNLLTTYMPSSGGISLFDFSGNRVAIEAVIQQVCQAGLSDSSVEESGPTYTPTQPSAHTSAQQLGSHVAATYSGTAQGANYGPMGSYYKNPWTSLENGQLGGYPPHYVGSHNNQYQPVGPAQTFPQAQRSQYHETASHISYATPALTQAGDTRTFSEAPTNDTGVYSAAFEQDGLQMNTTETPPQSNSFSLGYLYPVDDPVQDLNDPQVYQHLDLLTDPALQPPESVKAVPKRKEEKQKCIFAYLGCTYEGCKNEWKRHILTQHFQLTLWRCSHEDGRCCQGFNRKDLLQQHLRRMHKTEEADMDATVERMAITSREPPLQLTCPADGCQWVGKEGDVVDGWLEHVWIHYRKGEEPKLRLLPHELRRWAQEEHNILVRTGNRWALGWRDGKKEAERRVRELLGP